MKIVPHGIMLVISAVLIAACSSGHPEMVRPNILFITTDYTRGVDLPVTGAPFLRAPTLRQLCEEGAVFTRHSCAAPICMPARATIVTGHYPHAHSLWDNRSIPVRQPGLPFLITDLKNAGYQTIGIGKMHFYPFPSDYDYDIRISLEGKDRSYRDDDYERYLAERGSNRKQIMELSDGSGIPRGQSFFDWPLDEALHPDAFVGLKSREVIRQDKLSADQPWFMWISFTGPHNPWNAPERFSGPYRNMPDLPDGNFIEGELETKPLDYTRHRYGYGGDLMRLYDTLADPEKKKIRHNIRAGHYGSISYIDEWMGKIIEELRRKNQLDHTLIIFTSDHGSALFDNEMLHKGSCFPTQSIVPFVVWMPGYVEPGFRNEFSSHADLYATLTELAGIRDPAPSEGKSLVGLFQRPGTTVHEFVMIESALVTSLMNDHWLAGFHHITGEKELYDLISDPMCHTNLAGKEDYAPVLDTLEKKIVEWRRSTSPEGESIGEDLFSWYGELGDTAEIDKYRKGYIENYKRLVAYDDKEPGVTGHQVEQVLKQAGIE